MSIKIKKQFLPEVMAICEACKAEHPMRKWTWMRRKDMRCSACGGRLAMDAASKHRMGVKDEAVKASRSCERCGAKLNSYNTTTLCSACQKHVPRLLPRRIELDKD